MSTTAARKQSWAALAMALSGFAGLGYQLAWTQQASAWLGHESAAVLAVIAAFFGGLGIGGIALGARIEASARPRRWYVACELTIALWSAFVPLVSASWGALLLRLIGAEPAPAWQWLVSFVGTFALLLPATAAMGATLPAMARLTAELGRAGMIAGIYAANTLGAVLGVLVVAGWAIPTLGLVRASWMCALLNLVCAAIAWRAWPESVASTAGPPVARGGDGRAVLVRLAVTGLLGIAYEVVVVRVLSQVTEDTVYTFAALLAVYLIGTALGAAAYRRYGEPRIDVERLGDQLLIALACACLLGAASLWGAPQLRDALGPGSTVGAALLEEALLALPAFSLPTLVMGALFSHLIRAALAAGVSTGRAVGSNVLAAAAAPVLYGVLLVPTWGPKLALLSIPLGYLLLVSRAARWQKPTWAAVLAAVGIGVLAPALELVDVPAGGRLVSYREGVLAAVSVVESSDGVTTLRINNRQQEGSNVTRHVDARQAWLPLLLHPAPERALFLGLGTGVTASSATDDPELRVDVVELLPEVIEASAHFTSAFAPEGAERRRAVAADARRYVRVATHRYDVIVADNFHPARTGSGALYTVEHFRAVRERLAEHGVFCQWLPLHQLDLETLRSIAVSFLTAFPRAYAVIASNSLDTPVVGLVARADQSRWQLPQVRQRVGRAAQQAVPLALEDEYALLGSFVAGPKALSLFGAGAALNTDDLPTVSYRAPRVTYAPSSRPRDRLLELLGLLSLDVNELLEPADPEASQRLAAYWQARRRYLESGRDVRPLGSVEAMLAQVRQPLLDVLHISPDFRPAYDPLLGMASALGRSNTAAARQLLVELEQAQPARPDASRALTLLSDGAQ